MNKDKSFKRFLFTEIIFFLIITVFNISINIMLYNTYKQELIKNNTQIVSALIKDHPELEEEVIENLITGNIEEQKGKEILEKYGLTNIDNIEYLSSFHSLKNKMIMYGIITSSIEFIIIIMIIIIYLKKEHSKIIKLDHYMNDVLNEKYNLDIKDYEEGAISNLKNDIYKLTIKLKEQSDIAIKEKMYLEETLSDISHQIKTPLTSMYVINDLLGTDLDDTTKKEFLTKNQIQLERIEWLVSSLLKMSRLDSGSAILKQKPIKVKQLVESALEPLKIPIELKEINLKIDVDDKIKINCDKQWTIESLVNIIKNAYEHTNSKGNLIISAKENPLYIQIEIKDDGCGIKKEDLPHIFKRFYKATTNKESIGIGLNLAKKIIDKQSGEITVQSTLEKGTTFHIKFYKSII